MWGWDRGPTPHSVHSTHVRSTVRVGKGEHWTGTGLVSGVHPGTLERHTPTAAEYSPVHWCAFRVRVRCLEQAAVGFLDWFCSNDSNRHIYITSQHLQLNSRPPRLCDRPGRASPPKVVSPPRIVKLRARLHRCGVGLWGGWQQHSRRYSLAVTQGLVVETGVHQRATFIVDVDRQTRPRIFNFRNLGSLITFRFHLG